MIHDGVTKVTRTLYVHRVADWRAWLRKHHKTTREIWLVYYRKETGKPRISYNDAVDEALCYGWIDSLVKSIDTRRYAQRFSPRKPTSVLSAMNRERVRRLIAAQRMTQAGLASISHVFDHKRDTKRKVSAKIPADIVRALKRDPAAWKNFQRFPESYKRIRIGWIVAARHRRAVLLQRLRYFIKMTAQNKRFGMVQ